MSIWRLTACNSSVAQALAQSQKIPRLYVWSGQVWARHVANRSSATGLLLLDALAPVRRTLGSPEGGKLYISVGQTHALWTARCQEEPGDNCAQYQGTFVHARKR